MKRPDDAIRQLKDNLEHSMFCSAQFDCVIQWAEYLESQLQPRKTVKEAVEYYNSVWPDDDHTHIFYHPVSNSASDASDTFESADGDGYVDSSESLCVGDGMWGVICTREEFEQVVREKEVESEWTHVDAFGYLCRIMIGDPDTHGRIIILRRDGWYTTVAESSIKPIKPRISKAAAWDMLMQKSKNSSEVNTIKQNYEVE